MIDVSIGIFVYNEERNIANLLNSLLNQFLEEVRIKEIIVVSSGSTDKTNDIVKHFSKKNKKIKLITESERKGKAHAINLFLKKARSEIVVVSSGDIIPEKDCIEKLCRVFLKNKKLGLTGVRGIPINKKDTLLGSIVHYHWWISAKLPRFGEMIAFRKSLCPKISTKTAVDEAYIEAVIKTKGYEAALICDAVVKNKGPETIKDLIKQRKRIYIGHKRLQREKNYSVQSFNIPRIIKFTIEYIIQERSVKNFFYLFIGAIIETYSRMLGWFSMHFNRENPYIWEISESTKEINPN